MTPTVRQRRLALVLAAALLMAEAVVLYARLANALMRLRREQETKVMSAEAITAAIAHEIRQPLTRITAGGGGAQRFFKKVPPPPDKKQTPLFGGVKTGPNTNAKKDGFLSFF